MWVGVGGSAFVVRPGGNGCSPSLAIILLSLFLTAAARPAHAGYSVDILQPTGGGHSGASLTAVVRITDTGNSGMVQLSRFRVVCGGDELINVTDPYGLYFYPDPQNPGTQICDQMGWWWAHSKTSPGTYQITATLEWVEHHMEQTGTDENGYPIMHFWTTSGSVEDTDSFTLDNYGPVSITRASPNGTVSGTVNIQAEVVPAPAAGAGGGMGGPEGGGDFMDRVEYTAGDFHQDLTHIQGGYWDPETQQYVEAPNRWIGSWNTAEQYDPQNDPTGVARWGDPKYPDGTYNQQVKAYFGPNVKIGGEGTLTLKNKGKIRGTVRDAEGGSISGATVVVARYWQDPNQEPVQYDPNMPPGEPMNTQIERIYATATTDAGGHYEVEVYPGSYSLSASHPDYVKGGAGAGVWPGATTEPVDFYLNRRVSWEVPWDPGMMMGPRLADGLYTMTVCVVVRDQSGQPLAGVPVTFTATGGTITTDPVNTAVGADGLARACVNLTAPQSSEDVTIQIGATVGGGEGGGATTPNPLPITFGGVVATATMQPMTKAGGGEIGQYVGGKVRGNVRVSSSDGVTLTGLRARIKELTTDHPADWRELENVQDFTWAPPPEMGGRWGVTGSGQGYVDYWFEIDTVALGLHNFEHTLEITASFSTSQPLDPVTVTQNFTVKNVVVKNVGTSTNLDYIKYDPESTDASLNNPFFGFEVEDLGDAHQYDCYVFFRPTPVDGWWQSAPHQDLRPTYYYMQAQLTGPGMVYLDFANNDIIDPATGQPIEEDLEKGTYTFDIYVTEAQDAWSYDWYWPLDFHEMKTEYMLGMAAHGLEFRIEDGQEKAYASYTLADDAGTEAEWVKIDLLDSLLNAKASDVSGPGTALGTPYANILLRNIEGTDLAGDWRAIFMAPDKHGDRARDHEPNRMVAVNQVLGRAGGVVAKVHPVAEDFAQGKVGRVLISAMRNDGYHTTAITTKAGTVAQTQDGKVTVTVHLTPVDDAENKTVYFRVVDPAGKSPYAARTNGGDNQGGPGILSLTQATATRAVINGTEVAAAETILTFTNQHGGNNYQVEASLDANFAEVIGRTCILVAWKRVYLEKHRMYQKGATLTDQCDPNDSVDSDPLAEVPWWDYWLTVDNKADFANLPVGTAVTIFTSLGGVTPATLREVDPNAQAIKVRVTGNRFADTLVQYMTGVRTSDTTTWNIASDAGIKQAFGDATDGSDGGVFVEFKELPDRADVPKYTVFPNYQVLFYDYCEAWAAAAQGDDRRNVVQLVAASRTAGKVPGTDVPYGGQAKPDRHMAVVFAGEFSNDALVSHCAAHELGHMWITTKGSGNGGHVDNVVQINNWNGDEYCLMSYARKAQGPVSRFCVAGDRGGTCIYRVRDGADPLN